MSQPRYWFNEQRNPAIGTGIFAFPAYLLPILVAVVFIWTKPHRRFRRHLNENPFELGPGVLRGVRNDRTGDFARQLQGLLALFHVSCTGRALSQGIDFYREDIVGYGLAEALSLLVGGLYLDTSMLTSYLAASLGWVLLTLDQRTFAAAAILSLPCAWQLLGHTGIYHWQSGILLFILALDCSKLDVIQQAQALTLYRIKCWTLATYLSCLLLGGTLNLLRSAAEAGQGSLEATVNIILAWLYDTFKELMRVLVSMVAFLSPMAINCAITGFLAACIGWRPILLGTPAKPPFSSSIAPVAGTFLYLMLWCLLHMLQHTRRQGEDISFEIFCNDMILCADGTGLASVIMLLLWLIACVLPHLHLTL